MTPEKGWLVVDIETVIRRYRWWKLMRDFSRTKKRRTPLTRERFMAAIAALEERERR